MAAASNSDTAATTTARSPILPRAVDRWVLGALLLGFASLYLPSYWHLAQRIWPTDEQGHGPIILAVSWWLIYSRREQLAACIVKPNGVLGALSLAVGLGLYILGRSQFILFFEVLSQILVLCALLLLFLGLVALRIVWFPLFFLLFMVPLPGSVVASVTGPLKSMVSAVAAALLYDLGYPVGRAGVILTVGPYQLLVADACAGLNSMFTLEALGMLYMNLMRYTGAVRNVVLAILIIPISFVANTVRVMILVLVTYYLGDEAGQGFIHGFAGIVLFIVGLALMLATDKLLRQVFPHRGGAR